LSGAKAAWTQLEVVSNNLANTSTDGFKEHRVALSSVRSSPNVLGNSFVSVDEQVQDMSDGPLRQTDSEMHLALRGRGFFAIQGEDGEILQRSGNFRLDSEGRLVNQRGQAVLTDAGPLEIPDREHIVVDKNGVVRTENGGEIGRLKLVDVEQATTLGHGQWRAVGQTRAGDNVEVLQGVLEGSNADPIKGMIELVEASRYFEAYQKAMKTSDEMDSKANEIMRTQ
jgi:flagellar basal body rod protein FlgG